MHPESSYDNQCIYHKQTNGPYFKIFPNQEEEKARAHIRAPFLGPWVRRAAPRFADAQAPPLVEFYGQRVAEFSRRLGASVLPSGISLLMLGNPT